MADIEKKELNTEKVDEKKNADKKLKSKKEDKPSLLSRIGTWYKGFKAEFNKIVWTAPKTVVTNSLVVIAVCIVVAAVIGVLDVAFNYAIAGLGQIF